MSTGAEDFEDEYDQDDVDLPDEPVMLEMDTTTRIKPRQARPWQVVTLDGEPLRVRQPKGAFFIDLAARLSQGTDLEQASAMDDVLVRVFDEDSAAHVRARLDDDEDEFDVDDFGMILGRLRELWGKGRAGSANASKSPRRKSGGRSTARSRSAG